ncbi:MAG TPA: glycosyltransferase family A protein, partial [Sphingomonas sp.]|nr:glycosyltransferase family A protein [Sphingomonas sp.]
MTAPTLSSGAAPTISVVMPTYNGAGLIAATIHSVMAQTFGDFELLVVDDRSQDATRDIVAGWPDPRVRLIALEANGGPVVARNRGVAQARGRYIAALDHDDLCHPDRFARQVAYLDANPDCAILGTQVDILEAGVLRASRYPPLTNPTLIAWLTWIGNPIAWSSVMVRTAAARALDPFTRPEVLYAEDFDLYHRMQPIGGLARLDEALVIYRVHPGGVSQRFADQMEHSAVRVLQEAHADRLPDPTGAAHLIVRHLMAQTTVRDRAV